MSDITNRKTIEKELSESETKYRELIEQSPDSIVTVDLKGFVTSCNSSYEKFTGYSKEDILGAHFSKLPFLNIGDMPFYIKIFSDLLRNKFPRSFESSWAKKDGSIHFGEIIVDAVKRDNKVVGFQAITRDITERKRLENKLKEIQNLSKELALTSDIKVIAEKTVKAMKNVLNFDTAFFVLREDNLLKAKASIGISENEKIEFDINLKKGIVPWVAREGKTYLTNNTKKDKISVNIFGEKIPKSELCVPIKVGNDVLGALNTESQNLNEYTEEDVHMLEALASEVAVAVAYSKSLNRIQDELNSRKQTGVALRKSEEKYKELVENVNSIISKFDKDSRIISMNEYGLKFFGYKEEELIGKKWTETIAPKIDSNGRNLQSLVSDIFANPEKYAISINENIKKNGELVWIHWTNKPIKDEKENLIGMLSVGSDYTIIKKAEEALRESEEKFRTFLEKANDAILIFNDRDEIIDSNETATRLFGYSKEEFLSMTVSDIQAPEVRGVPGTQIKREFELFADRIFESLDIDKYGNKIPVEVSISKIQIKGERLAVGVIRDIRERKKLEEKIKESEQRYTELFHDVPEPIWETSADGIMLDTNKATSKLFGYPLEELIGRKVNDLYLNPEDRVNLTNKLKEYGTIRDEEAKLKRRDGKIIDVQITASVRKDNNGNVIGYKGILHNITELKEMEEEVKEREATLKGIFSAAPVGINLFKNRIWVWSNEGMEELTGYCIDELLGKSPRFIYESDEEYERVGKILYKKPREKDIIEIETKFITKNGTAKDVYIRNSLLDYNDYTKGYITVVLDITDRKKSQKQIDENLEYFAHLVDHIRNPLAIMSGFIQVEAENEKTKERLLRQIDRIEDLIKQLDKGWMDTEDTRKFLRKYY